MKKFLLGALLVAMLTVIVYPAMAWDAAKQEDFGLDKNGMHWWLLDYGKDETSGAPFAIVRKYYSNKKVKEETVELIMSKFGISGEIAGSLYFTEYGYEYTEDGKQFALTYLCHYDMLGHEIRKTEYGTDDNPKTFSAIPAGSTPAKAAVYIFGKSKSTATSTKSTTSTKSSVPSNRIVRAKKK